LGYKIFPHYNLVSHKTAKKIERKMKIQFNKYQLGLINEKSFYQSRQSYLGILKYAKAENIKRKLVKITANTNT